MSIVDERIVKMVFDNGEFVTKIAGTISSLTQLNKATDEVANNSGNGISALGKAFQQAEIMSTQAGFHIRDVWLKTASILEYQVAGKIVKIGKDIANAMTFEGISDGFREYELKMGSVQTIMAGTGESLQTVNKYLEELNKYSDQTIYSFADMTNNIGKFTNAGVKLEDAVAAIKGIANEAAISGANSNEASRAMYNFSQALSAGYVKLIDWKSIENANMATLGFKETLLEVASTCGTVEKDANGMYKILSTNAQGKKMEELVSGTKNFNDSLQQQWMTTEVLTKALKIYATDVRSLSDEEKKAYRQELQSMGLSDEQIKKFEELGSKATDAASEIKTFSMMIDTLKEAIGSGWAQTFEYILGDFEQAKALWTEVGGILGGIIDESSKSRNEILKTWNSLKEGKGGRLDLIEALRNTFKFLMNVARPISNAMKEVFPPITIKNLQNLTTGILEFTKKLQFSSIVAGKIKDAAKGFFSIFDIGLKFVKAFLGAILPAGKGLSGLGSNLLDAATNLGKFISGIDEAITKNKTFEKLFENIGKVVKPIFDFIMSGAKGATGLLAKLFASFTDNSGKLSSAGDILQRVFDNISGGLENIKKKFDAIKPLFEGLKSLFKGIGKVLGTAFKEIGDSLTGFASKGAGNVGLISLINSLISGGILYKLFSGAKSFSSLGDSVSGVLDSVSGAISSFQKKIEADNLMNIAKAIGILAAALFVIAMVDENKLLGATGAITALMFGIAGAMAVMMKAVNSFSTTQVENTFSIFGKKLFGSNTAKTLEMAVTLQAISKALIAMGAAVLMMAIGLKVVSTAAEGGHLWDSFAVISLILAELTGVAIVLGKWGGDTKNATKGLITMTGALILMAVALKMVSKVVEGGNAWESLGILSIMLAELTGIVMLVQNFGKYKMTGMTALISLAVSLNLCVFALKSVSDALGNEGNHIWESLGIISIMLAELAGVTILMSKFGGFAALGGIGAIMAAAALLILVQALKQISDALGKQDQHVWQALGVIAASLAVLAVGLTLMAGTIPGAAGLLVASAALVVLGAALKIIGSMSLAEVGKGLLAIAGSLLFLSAGLTAMILALPGAIALTVAAFALTVLAGALKIFGSMSLGEIVKSLLTLGVALAGIAVLTSVLSVASPLILIFSAALVVFGVALSATGIGMTLFATGIQSLVAVIPLGAQALSFLGEMIAGLAPILVEGLMNALGMLAQKIVEFGPIITQATIVLIDSILTAIVASSLKFGEAVLALITGMLQVLADNVPAMSEAGANLMIAYIQAISEQIPRIVDEAYKCAIALIDGLATAIENNNADLITAVDHLMNAVIQAITQWLVEFTPLGLLIPDNVKEGIMSGELNVKDALDNVIKTALDGIRGLVTEFTEVGKDFIGGFISGLEDVPLVGGVVKAASNLGAKAVEAIRSKKGIDAHSDSWETIAVGHDFGGGFETGITDTIPDVQDASALLGTEAVDSITDSIEEGMPDLENVAGAMADNIIKPLTERIKEGTVANEAYSKSFERNRESLEKLDKRIKLSVSATKDLQGENLRAEQATIRATRAVEKHEDATLKDVKAMKTSHDQAATLHERNEQVKHGELHLTEATKENTEATEENTKAKAENAEATGKGGTATKKSADVMEYASDVVEAFTKKYGDLYKELGDDAPMKVAQFAVKKLAEETYKASVEAEKATDKNKKTKASIEEMIKAFTDMKEKLYDSVKSYFEGDKFFQKFETKADMTMNSLLENMKSNIDGVTNWANTLASLADKGVSQGLLKRLGELGPQGFEYVNAFANATTDQIEQANQMFEQAAVLPDSLSNDVLASYAKAGLNVVQGFANGINENTQAAVDAMNNTNVTTYKELTDFWVINSPSEKTYEAGTYLVRGLENAIINNTPIVVQDARLMSERIFETISEILDREIFVEMGKEIALGLAEGMSDQVALEKVTLSALALSQTASSITELFNLISSPSKLYHKYGSYIAEGFALGMEDGIPFVESGAAALSTTVKKSMDLIQSIVDDEMNLNPVVSPVLDLTGLRNKTGQIRGLFPRQSLSLASSVGIGRASNTSSTDAQNGAVTQQINFTQNNYSPKALSRVDIYRQTKNQVSMMKGVLANA